VDVPSPQDFGEMFNLIGGYRISQAIYVVVELGIPDLLAAGPRRCDELARATNTHAPTLFRILRFLTGAGFGLFVEYKVLDRPRHVPIQGLPGRPNNNPG
jgi:hypothetical protein